MKCESGRCYSPVACEGFGYCRELNQAKSFHQGKVLLYAGDCQEVLKNIADNSVDAVCTDPPYHLTSIVRRFGAEDAAPCKVGKTGAYARASRGFMGKQWDGGDIAFRPELWAEVLRVLKPGGHMVCFGGTRTYHRMTCAIEDAGFDVRDAIMWHYGSGFPKSHDVAKQIDKGEGFWRGRAGAVVIEEQPSKGKEYERNDKGDPITDAVRQWQGYGTALKPATEIICLARKPISESTVAANVLRWGTGALNIDGCRIESGSDYSELNVTQGGNRSMAFGMAEREFVPAKGRWPANLCHDGSPEVLAGFPETTSGTLTPDMNVKASTGWSGGSYADRVKSEFQANSGSAARYFYTAKADADDRLGSKHPTVKPVDLMQWLVRLVCPKNGTCLDPFAGTGTTGAATFIEGCKAILIEREAEYLADIERRMGMLLSGQGERSRKLATPDPHDTLPLFAVMP